MTPSTLPHSGIPGSTLADSSPRLIAADHALHRLLTPRHPPCALRSATPAPARAHPDRSPPGPRGTASCFAHLHLFRYWARCPIPKDEGCSRPAARRCGHPHAAPRDQLLTDLLRRSETRRLSETRKTGRASRRPVPPWDPLRSVSRAVCHQAASLLPYRFAPKEYITCFAQAARGGAGEIRTPDLPRARRALSH
jgi:hypothetical protein